MARALNFNPGPAGLPLPALERAQREFLDFHGTGMSILEHSHRGAAYEAVHNEAAELIRELLGVPGGYEILFLQGGASMQFAMVPMNLLPPGRSADYLLTGVWSEKAYEEAQRIGTARIAASTRGADKRYTRVPIQGEIDVDPRAAYVHMTTNNTIFGTQWHALPDVGSVPLVADMSSDILWRRIDVSRFALIYAGAQKNLGPSGVTVVIARSDLVAAGRTDIPMIFRYATHAAANSLYNTPPTFAIYLVREVCAWIKETGGLDAMEARNRAKGDALYAAIDARPDFFRAPVEKASRSYMNVVFRLPTPELEKAFITEAAEARMVGLAGHRTAGGIRVSLYNAVTLAAVQSLIELMADFARRHGA